MSWLQKMLLPLVKSYVAGHLDMLDVMQPKIVALLEKNPPFAGNDALATSVSNDVLAVVKAEVTDLLSKI